VGVFVATFAAQRLLTDRIQVKVARKLAAPRQLHTRPRGLERLTVADGLHLTLGPPDDVGHTGVAPPSPDVLKVGGHEIQAFDWRVERTFWDERAAHVRQTFLDRTQETAEKWRTVFTGLLAVFGAVLVINKPDLPQSGAGEFIKVALVVAVALALHAVAYTGWAAAGLPKMLIDVNAETAFEADTQQACYSLARLRVGITCGALTALALTLAFAAALA